MPEIDSALTDTRDGVILAIEVTPNAKGSLFPAGLNPWRKTVGCRVAAQAVDGRANAAVLALIAGTLDLPSGSVQIRSGATASVKKVLIKGVARTDLLQKLSSLMGPQQ